MGRVGDLPWVPLVSTPAGCGGPSPGTWASGPWPLAPDPRLSGEPGVSPPGPPHLGLSEEGQPGKCGQAPGVGPRGLWRLTIASSGKGPGVPQSQSSPGSLAPAPAKHKVGPVRGSAWTPVGSFPAGVAGVSLVGPSCPFLAQLPRPDGSNPRSLLPPPFVLWPRGREAEVEGGVSLFSALLPPAGNSIR